jgi:hypothetical protein
MKILPSSLLALLCLLLCGSLGLAQSQQAWVQRYSLVSSATNQVVGMALAPDGNIVVAGSSASTNGDLDYVAIKYSPSGQQLWLSRYDSPGHGTDQLRGMTVDLDGNTLLTGTTKTVKLDPSGNLLWSAPYGGRAVAADTNGNVFVTGFSDLDYATAKLTAAGTNLWTRTFSNLTWTNLPDISSLIAVRPDGSVSVSGLETESSVNNYNAHQIRTITYDGAGNQLWTDDSNGAGNDVSQLVTANSLVLSPQGYLATFGNFPGIHSWVTKVFDQTGNILWTWFLDADGNFSWDGFGIGAAWGGAGNLYLTGLKANTAGDYDIALVKLSTNGHKIWLSQYHGSAPGQNQPNAIDVDSAGNAFVTGYSPGPGSGNDIITLKYAGSNLVWIARYNGPGNGDDVANSIVLDTNGGVYVSGYSATTNGGTEFVTIKYQSQPTLNQPQKRADGNFQFQLNSWVGQTNTVESSSNLMSWSALTSVVVTNVPMPFVDLGASNFPARYYRVRIP